MKRRLSTPLMENMTEAAIISFLGDLCTGAPARVAMSASPVASITRPARIASRPALLSVMTPRIAPFSMIGATHRRCSRGATPASCTSTSATHLNISASSAWLKDCGSGIAAPMAFARCSNSILMPSQSTGCAWRDQAKRPAPGLCSRFDLNADAFAIHRVLVPVPGKALDAHLRDVAAEAAVAVDQRRPGPGTGGGERRRKTPRAAADHEHISFENHIN